MKRHEALTPLSREHHEVLILCQLMKEGAPVYKGLPESTPDRMAYAMDRYRNAIVPHFQKEALAFGQLRNGDAEVAALVDELLQEHERIATLFNELESSAALVHDMDRLGRLLEQHVRKEERVFFPLIQDRCPEALLQRIGPLLQ